jgi:hypothetical protein
LIGTGLGGLALGSGVPLAAIVYTQLVLQLALAGTIAIGVPDKLGGAVAMALVMILPLGAFVTWAETVLQSTPSQASAVAGLGLLVAAAAVGRPLLVPARAGA